MSNVFVCACCCPGNLENVKQRRISLFFVLVCLSEGIALKERGCVCVRTCVGRREDRKARLLHSVTDRSDIYDPVPLHLTLTETHGVVTHWV